MAVASKLLVGINSRDLATPEGGARSPGGTRWPAAHRRAACGRERRGHRREDAARLARAGYDMALIGSALMTTARSRSSCSSAMIAAGRGAR